MLEMTDEVILSMCKQNHSRGQVFTWLMQQYQQRIYWHIRRLVVTHEDAEDVLQETFIKVYAHLHTFAGESAIYTWVYRIATNESLKLLRNRKKFLMTSEEESARLISQLPAASDNNAEEILLTFQAAILRLPEKQRLVFTLRYYDELSYQDISEVLGSSVSSLKTNYHLASTKVKEYLKTHG